MKKLIFFIGLILAVLILGAGYWYFWIYQPEQYAKAVLAVVEEMTSYGETIMSQPEPERYAYQSMLGLLEKHIQFYWQIQGKVEKLKPPLFAGKEVRQIKEDFIFVIGMQRTMTTELKARVTFVANAASVLQYIDPGGSTMRAIAQANQMTLPRVPRYETVDDFLNYWDEYIVHLRPAGQELFLNEPVALEGDVSYEDLKKMWEEGIRGLEAALQYFATLDRRQSLPSTLMKDEIKRKFPDIIYIDRFFDDFRSALESMIIRTSGTYGSYPSPSEESKQRFERFGAAILELQKRYGK